MKHTDIYSVKTENIIGGNEKRLKRRGCRELGASD
uniref:Uncharacterized protein n=1 Tax=Rhizophora mucronata TaxID=61149 RepID=A0A2P2P579_RHIMU